MYGKGFLGNMTENLQADCVQSRQAGFMQCFPSFVRCCPSSFQMMFLFVTTICGRTKKHDHIGKFFCENHKKPLDNCAEFMYNVKYRFEIDKKREFFLKFSLGMSG